MTNNYKQKCISYTFNRLNPNTFADQLERSLKKSRSGSVRTKHPLLPIDQNNPETSDIIPEIFDLSLIDVRLNEAGREFFQEMAQLGWGVEVNKVYNPNQEDALYENDYVRSRKKTEYFNNVVTGLLAVGAGIAAAMDSNNFSYFMVPVAYKIISKVKVYSDDHIAGLDAAEVRPFVGFGLEFTPLEAVSDTIIAGTDFGSKPNSAPALTG